MQGLLLFIALAISQIHSGQATKSLIKDYAAAEATLAGVSVSETLHIISNESRYNPKNIHYNDGALGCDSVGLVQIRDCSHPDISKEEALDPVFSVEFLVEQLKDGNGHIWSTYDPSLNVTSNLANGG